MAVLWSADDILSDLSMPLLISKQQQEREKREKQDIGEDRDEKIEK